MRRFKWFKNNERETRSYPVNYNSEKEPISAAHKQQFIKAHIASRINGFNTAFARIYWTVEWPSNNEHKWGFEMYRHFNGKNAFNQAKSWCNFFLNFPPDGVGDISTSYFNTHFAKE